LVKAKASDIRANLARLEQRFSAVLLYGRDEGMVRERGEILARQIVDDINDPFSTIRLDADEVKRDMALLADEMAAMSMMGGRRLVRLERAPDGVTAAVASALEFLPQANEPGNFLLVTAGELAAGSKLRKFFEKSKTALAMPCYGDESQDVESLVRASLTGAGMTIEPAALSFLVGNLGGDRLATRGELDKLMLYMRGQEPARITLEDVTACVGDSASMALGDIAAAVTGGDVRRLDLLFDRAETRTESPVAILRIVSRRMMQFHFVCGLMEEGLACGEALNRLKPKLFFKDNDAFRLQAPGWRQENTARALDILSEAEGQCKSTGLPDRAIAMRACVRIAASVAPGRRRSA
jgi:DNA polymerase-3 subunit delta